MKACFTRTLRRLSMRWGRAMRRPAPSLPVNSTGFEPVTWTVEDQPPHSCPGLEQASVESSASPLPPISLTAALTTGPFVNAYLSPEISRVPVAYPRLRSKRRSRCLSGEVFLPQASGGCPGWGWAHEDGPPGPDQWDSDSHSDTDPPVHCKQPGGGYLSLSPSLYVSLSHSLSLYHSICLSLPLSFTLTLFLSITLSLPLSFALSLTLYLSPSPSLTLFLSHSLPLSFALTRSLYLSPSLTHLLFFSLTLSLYHSICLALSRSHSHSLFFSLYHSVSLPLSFALSLTRSLSFSLSLTLTLSITLSVSLSPALFRSHSLALSPSPSPSFTHSWSFDQVGLLASCSLVLPGFFFFCRRNHFFLLPFPFTPSLRKLHFRWHVCVLTLLPQNHIKFAYHLLNAYSIS